jgi:hypothetical protein
VRARVAGRLGIEVLEKQDGVRRDAVIAIEPSPGGALGVGHPAEFDAAPPNVARR